MFNFIKSQQKTTQMPNKIPILDVQVQVDKRQQTSRKMQYSSFQIWTIWMVAATVFFVMITPCFNPFKNYQYRGSKIQK